jgi:hypothetical protein
MGMGWGLEYNLALGVMIVEAGCIDKPKIILGSEWLFDLRHLHSIFE